MTDLFDDEPAPPVPVRAGAGSPGATPPLMPEAPLAERLRPSSIDDVIGQRDLLGPGKPLRVAFESGRLHSMILWGPPGSGKTTLARIIAAQGQAHFIAISAMARVGSQLWRRLAFGN